MVESGVRHVTLSHHGATFNLTYQVFLNNAFLFFFQFIITLIIFENFRTFRMPFVENLFICILLIFPTFYFEEI